MNNHIPSQPDQPESTVNTSPGEELMRAVEAETANGPSLERKSEQNDLCIATLERTIADLEQQVRDLKLRHLAEQQNMQRRAEQDIAKAHKFSLEKFARELLPVIDSFERALAMADKENTLLLPMIEGIELTLKSLYDALRKFGIQAIDSSGVSFNPDLHQALQMVDTTEHAANQVIMVVQKGYLLNDRLLRPAMVTVARSTG